MSDSITVQRYGLGSDGEAHKDPEGDFIEFADHEKREARLVKALQFYAQGKTQDDGVPGERREFGCGCCAGILKTEGEYTFTDYDADVIGLTAREVLAELNIPLKGKT